MKCIFCEKDNSELIEESNSIGLPYGNKFPITDSYMKCPDCDMEHDVSKSEEVIDALNSSAVTALNNIVKELTKDSKKLAGIERALHLPFGTIERWQRNRYVPPEGLALLQMIRTYRWLINVADEKYNEEYAKKRLREESNKLGD